MGYESYTNPATTTLAGNGGSITNSAASFNVAAGASLPSANFRIRIGTELIFVGARSTNALSGCVRGIEGTAAATHNDGDDVDHVLTAGGLRALGPYRGVRMAKAAADFGTWVNQGTSTIADELDGILLQFPGPASGNQLRGAFRSIPSTPYVITLGAIFTFYTANYRAGGLALRASASGKLISWGPWSDTGFRLRQWTDATTFNADYLSAVNNYQMPPMWLRVADDGSTRTWSFSLDGRNFVTVATNGHTDFLTADQVGIAGIGVVGTSGTESNYLYAFHYEEA